MAGPHPGKEIVIKPSKGRYGVYIVAAFYWQKDKG
jgi:hypothetical protein